MAVQTHNASISSLKRKTQVVSPSFDETGAISLLNGGNGNTKKRGREVAMGGGGNLVSMQPQTSSVPHKMIRLDQLQAHHPTFVSTGLQLAFGGYPANQNANQFNPIFSSSCATSLCSEEFAAPINQYAKELDLLLQFQAEQLRMALLERHDTHYKQMLLAAEKTASQILNKKQTELNWAVEKTMQLQNQLNQLQAESIALRTKAMADQATANSLHSQLQQAVSDIELAGTKHGGSPVEDAGSSYVDPNRSSQDGKLVCRVCLNRTVSVVILPCRHLCLCEVCKGVCVSKACPVCNCVGTGSVQVFLS